MANQLSKIAVGAGLLAASSAAMAADKPNILAIFGDDIGYWNISAYNQGMMSYKTPNIDRIANEARCSQITTDNSLVLLVALPLLRVKSHFVRVC